MKLVLLATTLLFYTQATETKKCSFNYEVTENIAQFSESKTACEKLNGELASEDLKDSENEEKAQLAVKKFRENTPQGNLKAIWLGISSKNMKSPLDKSTNGLIFSDGTDFDNRGFPYEWDVQEPDYTSGGVFKCVKLKPSGKMGTDRETAEQFALCRIEEECEDASSESERSRANLSVFALFMACGVFKTFFLLVGSLC